MKRWFCFFTMLLLLMLPALAGEENEDNEVEVEYTGILDPETGQPISSGNGAVRTSDGNIVISSGVEYDPNAQLYLYTLSGYGQCVSSNVMTGMVTTGPVSIQVPNGLSLRLYRNGELVEITASGISEPGAYTLNTGVGSATENVMKFTIVGNPTGSINAYRLPAGFSMDEVLFNGQSIDCELTGVDLTDEGHYQISYHCYFTQESYYLEMEIDHTAPVLKLAAVEEKSTAHGPVDLSDLEEGASMQIELNGKTIGNTERLTQPGNYVVTVADEAGNVRSYAFTIQVYLNASSVIFFLILLAVCIVLVVYLLRNRRRMRVR